MNPPEKSAPRCAACGGPLSSAGWCGRCVLGELATESAAHADATGGIFSVPGHVVLEELGRGAAGIVYRARQENPAREVALKILRPHEAGSAESRARFRLEATTVAGLDHPAILPVLSVGDHDGLPFFTMKRCAGGSLAQRVASYRGKWRECATLVATLADAVQHAHARGVLHRDLKPGNILFDEAGRAFVSDFGIAKSSGDRDAGTPVTQPHAVMGTRGYVAPEVLRAGAGAATLAADVFGLGAILHELLAGTPPAENSDGATAAAATALKPAPRDLAVIAGKCLQRDPAARYASAAALAEDLRAWLAGRPIAARPVSAAAHVAAWARRNPTLAALAAVLVVTLAGGAAALAVKNRELRVAFAQSQQSLADALVAQASAVRQGGNDGQRREALKLLARAATINPSAAARDEAVAALALPDWDLPVERRPWVGDAVAVVPSADLGRVLTDDGKGNFSLRETATGAELWSWRGPASAASPMVYSRDGRWVAVRLKDDTVHVLATADGRAVLRLEGRPYAFKGIFSEYGQDMDFSPDGARLAVTRPQGGVSFHRVPGGELDGEWTAAQWVTTITFSPDGARLAVGGGKERKDNLLAVIDARTGKILVQQPAAHRVEFLAWSHDGQWLASRQSGDLPDVRAAGTLAVRTVLPQREALHARFLTDGNRLLMSAHGGQTRLWDISLGRLLLSKSDDGRPGTWYGGEPLTQWRSHRAGPVLLTTLRDSPVQRTGYIAVGGVSVQISPGAVALAADGRWLAVARPGGGTLFDTTGRRKPISVRLGVALDPGMLRLDVAGGAAWVVLGNGGLWRHPLPRDASGEWGAPQPGEQVDPEQGFGCADLHAATGRLALLRRGDGTVKIIDVRTRATVARWTHAGARSAAFAPDGARLAVNAGEPGAPAAVHDALTGAVVATVGEAAGDFVAWSPDGRWIYAGSGDGKGALWRTADWTRGPELAVNSADRFQTGAFSPDSQWLALVDGQARPMRLIETATGRTLTRLAAPDRVSGLAFAGNERLCVVSTGGRVEMWDLAVLRRELGAVGLDWADR